MERIKTNTRTQIDAQTELLITENIGLVYFLVNKFNCPESEFEDLVSVGSIGLIKAAKTYDGSRNVKFSSYAGRCIKNEIIVYYNRHFKKWKDITFLDDPLCVDDEGNNQTLAKILPDETAHHETQLMDRIELAEAIQRVFNSLDIRSLAVFLADAAGWPQDYSVKQFGVSQSYISRIARKAKAKLKQYTKNNGEWQVLYNHEILSIHGVNHLTVQFPIDDKLWDNLTTWLFEVSSVCKQNLVNIPA